MFGRPALLALPLLALALTGCGGGSDTAALPAATPAGGPGGNLSLVALAVPKVAFDKLIPAFNNTDAGRGVTFGSSYGASGDQSRKVESGLETDVVLFSLEPEVTRLVTAGLVDAGWKVGEDKGSRPAPWSRWSSARGTRRASGTGPT